MDDEMQAMGPVDYLVVEFPQARVTGEPLARLIELVDLELVRVLDLLFVLKEQDGSIKVAEVTDLDDDGELDLQVLHGASSGLLGTDDVEEAGGVLEPGTAAALLVYENLWAIPFAAALHRAGAHLVASGRIPVNALLEALDRTERNEPAEV
jgi:Family of unknown function (DUF6325)